MKNESRETEIRICSRHGPIGIGSAIPAGRWKFRCPKCKRFLGRAAVNGSATVGNSEVSSAGPGQASTRLGIRIVPRIRADLTVSKRAGVAVELTDSRLVQPTIGSISPPRETSPAREEVIDVSVFSKPERFRVMRLSEEEEFVLDQLARRIVQLFKEDADYQLLVRVAKQQEEVDDLDEVVET